MSENSAPAMACATAGRRSVAMPRARGNSANLCSIPRAKCPRPSSKTSSNLARGEKCLVELTRFGDVAKQFGYRRNAVRSFAAPRNQRGHPCPELFDVAHEQIVFVAIVSVKSRAADPGSVEHMLDGDGFERFFLHKLHQRIAQGIARVEHARVRLCGRGRATGLLFGRRRGRF